MNLTQAAAGQTLPSELPGWPTVTRTIHWFIKAYVIQHCGCRVPSPRGHDIKTSITSFIYYHIYLSNTCWAFLIFPPPHESLWISEHRKRKKKFEAAVNYWVTHHAPEEVYSWERRWTPCPHFTLLNLLTQLSCEDTVTLSGITHIVQPACTSLRVPRNLESDGGDKGTEGNPRHQPVCCHSFVWKSSDNHLNGLVKRLDIASGLAFITSTQKAKVPQMVSNYISYILRETLYLTWIIMQQIYSVKQNILILKP